MSNAARKPTAQAPKKTIRVAEKFSLHGACDSHVHMVATEPKFQLWDGRVEDPASGSLTEWIARLDDLQNQLGFSRCVIVHSILYGQDNSVTLATLKALGPDRAKGVGLVPDGTEPPVLSSLAKSGVKAIRLNYVHGGVLTWEGACNLAPQLADENLHIEMLLHTHMHMLDVADQARSLPVPVVFDHIGWPDLALGVNDPGFVALLRLIEKGHAWVKLSAIYRLCDNPYDRAQPFIAALLEANPERCLWGSDWPHLMLGDASLPDAGALFDLLKNIAGEDVLKRVLIENPEELYGFEPDKRA